MHQKPPPAADLTVQLGRLTLRNPILIASGTFGYAREMERLVDFRRLGGILPKTITKEPRPGNKPWRTVETACGMLNSIGLDNDGIERSSSIICRTCGDLPTAIIVSIAGRNHDEFVAMARQLDGRPASPRSSSIFPAPMWPTASISAPIRRMCGRLVADCRKRRRCRSSPS